VTVPDTPAEAVALVLQAHVNEIVFDAASRLEVDCVLCQQAAAAGLWDKWFDLDVPEEAELLATLRLRAEGATGDAWG